MAGLIHIYCGEGKGKTTAAVGLTVRAIGAEKQVLFAQFLKKGTSSEVNILKDFKNISILSLSTHRGFYKKQNDEEKRLTQKECRELFEDVIKQAQNGIQLLILDEIISACNHEIITEASLTDFLKNKPDELEVVMTGRNPSQKLLDTADYITEMKKIKHPYDEGVKARHGIEF